MKVNLNMVEWKVKGQVVMQLDACMSEHFIVVPHMVVEHARGPNNGNTRVIG